MTTPGLVQFVTYPATSPTILLDVNNPPDGVYTLGDDFTLGAPQWETAPNMVGGDDGYREVEFTLAVDASYASAASAMSSVSRLLQGREGWLRLRRNPSVPQMFLHWYRTAPQALDWEHWDIDTYRLRVQLVCDPYLYGEPVTLASFTMNNRCDSGPNRMYHTYPADTFLGDAPTPLKLTITPTSGTGWNGYQPLIATTALASGQTQAQPFYIDLVAANWTAGTNVGADVSDTAYLGGSYRLWTATGAAMSAKLTGTITPTVPGLYKVLLRCGTSTDQTTFNLRLSQTFSGSQVYSGETKTFVRPDTTITQYDTWADLGAFNFPFGVYDLDPTDIATVAGTPVSIDAERVTGSGNLRLDALLLIPVETAATIDSVISTWRFHGSGLTTTRSGVWDGQRERFDAYDSGTTRANLRSPEPRGGWPRVTPGTVNLLHFMQQTQTDTPLDTTVDDDDVITDTCSVVTSYMPRYLHLRP